MQTRKRYINRENKAIRMRQVRYKTVKGWSGQGGSQVKSKMRNYVSDRGRGPPTPWALIQVFHFPTDRCTKQQIYDVVLGHLSTISTSVYLFVCFLSQLSVKHKNSIKHLGRFLARATKEIRQLYGADSDQNESICLICHRLQEPAAWLENYLG